MMKTPYREQLALLLNSYDRILLLPEHDRQWNSRLSILFQGRMEEEKLRGKILTIAPLLLDDAEIIPMEMMQEILHLYQLYEFTDKIIIGSLHQPFGRKWGNLLKTGCMTEMELVRAMLGIPSVSNIP